jgi:uncharacterized membrane protein
VREAIVHGLSSLSPEAATFIIAMLPILELRGAIPYALGVGMPWPEAYLLAVTGTLVPVVPILLFLGPVSERLSRLPAFGPFFEWVWRRSRKRTGLVEKYGPWGLALFVAVPLPVTGGWTGAAVAYLLAIPFRRSFPAITAGVLLAGVVVTLAVKGVIGLGSLFIGGS